MAPIPSIWSKEPHLAHDCQPLSPNVFINVIHNQEKLNVRSIPIKRSLLYILIFMSSAERADYPQLSCCHSEKAISFWITLERPVSLLLVSKFRNLLWTRCQISVKNTLVWGGLQCTTDLGIDYIAHLHSRFAFSLPNSNLF